MLLLLASMGSLNMFFGWINSGSHHLCKFACADAVDAVDAALHLTSNKKASEQAT